MRGLAPTFLFFGFILFGCGTSESMLVPVRTLSSAYADTTTVAPVRQYNWTDFRLGHWEYDRGLGWIWVPGYTWSPSRVVWFTGFEYLSIAPLPPPDVVLPRPGEAASGIQGGHDDRRRAVQGGFDRMNLEALLMKIQTHRVVATGREALRAVLSLDFPMTLLLPERISPPGPPPVPLFFFVIPGSSQ